MDKPEAELTFLGGEADGDVRDDADHEKETNDTGGDPEGAVSARLHAERNETT